ncbi:unnamed protein product, partial [Pylaiella littoralis]
RIVLASQQGPIRAGEKSVRHQPFLETVLSRKCSFLKEGVVCGGVSEFVQKGGGAAVASPKTCRLCTRKSGMGIITYYDLPVQQAKSTPRCAAVVLNSRVTRVVQQEQTNRRGSFLVGKSIKDL